MLQFVETRPLNFRARQRLTHAMQFQRVFGARVRRTRGPVAVFAFPNELAHARLGLSIGKRCGPAATRNTLKRRLREAFRLVQHDLPRLECDAPSGGSYDFVVTTVAHEPLSPASYADMVLRCAAELHRDWQKRLAGSPGAASPQDAKPATPATPPRDAPP
ncbi:MAG: ribonuclease P protein component [Planctomycetota bacterium]|nr:ribonuclease P protein component [Planctomycetota bacterium]